MSVLLAHFQDPNYGFYDTSDDHEELLVRIKDTQDNATPSGNSLAALALIQMASYEGEPSWQEMAEKALGVIEGMIVRYPLGYAKWLCALFNYVNSIKEIALIFPANGDDTTPYEHILWSTYRPDCIVAATTYPPELASPKLLQDRALIRNQPTVYVCHNFICELPVQTPEQLGEKLL